MNNKKSCRFALYINEGDDHDRDWYFITLAFILYWCDDHDHECI